MKGLAFIKEVAIIIAAAVVSGLFFLVWFIAYPFWYTYQAIKEHIKKHRNHGNEQHQGAAD